MTSDSPSCTRSVGFSLLSSPQVPIQTPLAINAARPEDASTRTGPLVESGVARQTYQEERQTNA